MTKLRAPQKILLDADYIPYAAGFAAEHRSYLLTHGMEGADHDHIVGEYSDAKSCTQGRAEAVGSGLDDAALRRWELLEVEPVENALHSAKMMIRTLRARIEEKFGRKCALEVYLTGTGNFREKIATIRPYKGNRAPWHRPRLYRELRGYLVDTWGARVIHDQEADDEVAILQSEAPGETIIAGIDKDLLQVPGWHYNPHKDAFAKITPALGQLLFYRQTLSGDTTDNIGGCYKCGAKAAERIIQRGMSEHALWSACVDAYAASIERYGSATGYAALAPQEAALENARLVRMRRSRDEALWTPPQAARSKAA